MLNWLIYYETVTEDDLISNKLKIQFVLDSFSYEDTIFINLYLDEL